MHAKIRSIEFEAVKLRKLCEKEGIDFDLFSHTGTLKLVAKRIADILSELPDDHVVLVCVG